MVHRSYLFFAPGLLIPFAHWITPVQLGRATSVEGALAAARMARIVTVLPLIEKGAHGRLAHLPLEANYGGPVFDFGR
jgi:hypothetical protein